MQTPNSKIALKLIGELYSKENSFLNYDGAIYFLTPFGIDPLINCYAIVTTNNPFDMYNVTSFEGEPSLFGIHAHDIPVLIIEKLDIPCEANYTGRGRQFRAQLQSIADYFKRK